MNDPNLQIITNHKNDTELNKRKSLLKLIKNVFFPKKESLEESVTELIKEHDESGEKISEEEKILLHNILSYRHLDASDIMIPSADITSVPVDISLEELKKIIIDTRHSRIPVFENSLDNILGFINIKDLLPVFYNEQKFDMRKIIREVLIISPSMKLLNLLAKMRESRIHMAMVVDEYGETDGLVTIEDLIEEIIGELEDEHDQTLDCKVVQNSDGSYEVSARMSIDDLEKKIEMNIISENRDDFDTVGGLILHIAGYVPQKGEIISHSGIDFEILDSDPRRVKKVLIRK